MLWIYIAEVFCGEFSPDGKNMATGSFDKNIYLWQVKQVVTIIGYSFIMSLIVLLHVCIFIVIISSSNSNSDNSWNANSDSIIDDWPRAPSTWTSNTCDRQIITSYPITYYKLLYYTLTQK